MPGVEGLLFPSAQREDLGDFHPASAADWRLSRVPLKLPSILAWEAPQLLEASAPTPAHKHMQPEAALPELRSLHSPEDPIGTRASLGRISCLWLLLLVRFG